MDGPSNYCCGWCAYGSCCNHCRPAGQRCGGRRDLSGASRIAGSFCEYTATLRIRAGENFTDVFPAGDARVVTVFIKNTGEHPLAVSLQNSPNGQDFIDDPQRLELEAGKTGCLTPYIFSKYIRVAAQSGKTGAAVIWVQMQNHTYFQYPL